MNLLSNLAVIMMCAIYTTIIGGIAIYAVKYDVVLEDYVSPTVFTVSSIQKIETNLCMYICKGTVVIDNKQRAARLVYTMCSDLPYVVGDTVDTWYSQSQYHAPGRTHVALTTKQYSLQHDMVVLVALLFLPGVVVGNIIAKISKRALQRMPTDNDDPYDMVDIGVPGTKIV